MKRIASRLMFLGPLLLAVCAVAACGPSPSPAAPVPPSATEGAALPSKDSREAFASNGIIGSPDIKAPAARIIARFGAGAVRAGPIGFGNRAFAVFAQRDETNKLEERLVSMDPDGAYVVSAAMPSSVLAMAAAGNTFVVACSDGSLLAFVFDAEATKLSERWRRSGAPINRLVTLPSNRVATSAEDGSLGVLAAASGAEAWHVELAAPADAVAYAPGLVIAATGANLGAYSEKEGHREWNVPMTAPVLSASAGRGLVAAVDEKGRLTTIEASSGKILAELPGPFDAAIPPVLVDDRVIVARKSGGATEFDAKTGASLQNWVWKGAASFIAADSKRFFAAAGRRFVVGSRDSGQDRSEFDLPSSAFGPPAAIADIGLVLPCVDGCVVRIGEPGPGPSKLDAVIVPPANIVDAIASGLEKYRPRGGLPIGDYLRFDIFVNGMPVTARPPMTAFRFEPETSGKLGVALVPDPGDGLIAVFDDAGIELEGNRDELGAAGHLARYFEKGKQYWLAVGRREAPGASSVGTAPSAAFALVVR